MWGSGRLKVFDAVPENQAAGERFDSLDLGRDKKSRLPGREWRGEFDQRIQLVLLQAVEADAALGYVFAFDDFVGVRRVADARTETHADSNVAPLVHGPSLCIELALANVLALSRGTHNLSGRRGNCKLGWLQPSSRSGHHGRSLNIGQVSEFRNG